jgi:uncharacterized protein involved in exopolysaccharide biosynthesis
VTDATAVQAHDDAINAREMLATVRARRWWVIGSVLFFSVAFTAAALIMTPVYRAKAILIPTNTNQESGIGGGGGSALGQLGGLASLAGVEIGNKGSPTDEALAVLKSREFTERFINDRHLLPVLFAKKWDAATGTWRGGADHQPTPGRVYNYFNEKIRWVEQDKKTGLITVQIDWKGRLESAQWANELVQQLNQEMRTRAIAEADASLGFLEKELQTTSVVPVRDAVARLIETQVKKRMLANVTQQYVFRIVDHALPSDVDDPLRPKKLLMFVGGPLVGLIMGILAVLVVGAPRPRPTAGGPA